MEYSKFFLQVVIVFCFLYFCREKNAVLIGEEKS